MRLALLAVGKRGPFDAETDDYLSRAQAAGRPLGWRGPALHAVEAPKALRGAERQAREADLLRQAVPDGARVVVLDERGEDRTSRQLARLIEREPDGLAFLIGGADGFADALRADLAPRTAATLRFGRAVWPHMLARLMLAEQLYRSATILTGHPYHRD